MRIVAIVLWMTLGPATVAQEPAASPRFEGGPIPDPPARGEPWTPPATKLPRFLVEATAALGEQGLGDPRKCEYRAIRPEADRDRPSDLPPWHGWVLPPEPGGGPRFAVGWDGLVHPLASIGPAADLEADIRALLQAQEKRRAEFARLYPGEPAPGFSSWSSYNHTDIASHEDFGLLKVIVLLRLGRADLAERAWAVATDWAPDRPQEVDPAEAGATYLSLATDWAWCLFDRGLKAHADGNDPLALASFRELACVQPLIEAKAGALGVPRPEVFTRARVAGLVPTVPYLDFLGPLPDLLADQERRAKEPKPAPNADPSKIADRDARIAALIRGFDGIVPESDYFTGRADPASSSIVKAVIREGDAAVGPLLDCLEHDDRLTRFVHRDGRHGTRFTTIGTVTEAAFSALVAILETREFGPVAGDFQRHLRDRAGRKAVAAEVRAHWRKNRGLTAEERWYRTLLDDGASTDQWIEAAEALSRPADVSAGLGWSSIPYRAGGKVPGPRGEALRGRTTPSVATLMARRVDSIDPGTRVGPRSGPGDTTRVYQANRMARALADWDLEAALPTLKARVARCASIVRSNEGDESRHQGLEATIAELTLLRLKGKDDRALDDYAAWVRTLTPTGFDFFPVELFEPTWRYPDHPSITEAVEFLFANPRSPWVPLFEPRERGWASPSFKSGLIISPLLGLAPFRKLVIAGLADKRPNGSIDTDAQGQVEVAIGEEGTTRHDPPQDDPLRPKPSTRMPLRLADLYCSTLEGLEGTPPFEMYWPEARRDAAIAECVAFLARFGERFRHVESARTLYESASSYPRDARAVLVFPTLDRPASAEDVRAGRAIFHLEGAEVRRWPVPTTPLDARWTTLVISPDDPGLGQFRGYDKKVGEQARRPWAQIEMLQGGRVWQAEEVFEGGTWRRYYGFVGRNELVRLPAEAVEFPHPWNTGWYKVSAELDGRVVPPGGVDDGTRVVQADVAPGAPLPVEVALRNHRGVDTTIPADYARAVDGGLSLREGLSIRLSRLIEANPAPGRPRSDEPRWDEILPKAVRRHKPDGSSKSLAPTEVARGLRVDLRDMFDVVEPGHYRVDFTFDDQRDAEAKPSLMGGYFTVAGASKAD